MKDKNGRVLTRREFAQRAALLSATASLATAEAVFPASSKDASPQTASASANLNEAGQAEANSRFQQIMDLYSGRFDDAQKESLKSLCAEMQPALDHIRAYELQNGDAPALYLKPLVEREKKPEPAAIPTIKKP